VEKYVNEVYRDTHDNRKIRKAYRNQLMDIIKTENEYIKESLRVIQKKKPMRKRKRRDYTPTPYVQFCREMRQKHSHNELAGKMQKLWRERRGIQDPITVSAKQEPMEEKKEEVWNPYIYPSDSDSDSE
jgi:hypothetical protein